MTEIFRHNRFVGAPFARGRFKTALFALGVGASLCACTPTIRVEVAPINIYAKLDADVRVRLDKEVQTAVQQNPDLF